MELLDFSTIEIESLVTFFEKKSAMYVAVESIHFVVIGIAGKLRKNVYGVSANFSVTYIEPRKI